MVIAVFRKEITASSGDNHVDELGRMIASNSILMLVQSDDWLKYPHDDRTTNH